MTVQIVIQTYVLVFGRGGRGAAAHLHLKMHKNSMIFLPLKNYWNSFTTWYINLSVGYFELKLHRQILILHLVKRGIKCSF